VAAADGTILGGIRSCSRWCDPVRLRASVILSEVPIMRARILVRRVIAVIVLAVAVIAAALAVAGASTAHHSLADNGVINSRN
jgi:hypothetical protein